MASSELVLLAIFSGGFTKRSIAGISLCRRRPTSFCSMMFCYLIIFLSVIFGVDSSPVLLPVQSKTVESWSDWGNCSRPCGGGVAERVRICHGNNDSATLMEESQKCKETVQYKLCNYQNCPLGKEGVRWHQLCTRYNNNYYHWRPYNPKVEYINPCALRCYAVQNIKLVVKLPAMPDGRLCSNPARDIRRGVCHRGECVKVGCDNILNSDKEIDVCGICGGNSRACEAVEGEFQTNNLKVGYNDVVQIPTGAKNIQIIEKRGKNYLALRNDIGDYFLNGNWLIERPGQIQVAGTLVHYRRPQLWVMGRLQGEWETITAPGPTNTSICVMVLCRDTSTHIAYKFTLPAVSQDGTLHIDSIIDSEDVSRAIDQEHFQAAEQSPSITSLPTATAKPQTTTHQTTAHAGAETSLSADRRHDENGLKATSPERYSVVEQVYTIQKTTTGARSASEGDHESSLSYGSSDPSISAFRPHAGVDEEPSVLTNERPEGLVIDIEVNSPTTPKGISSAEGIQTTDEIIGISHPMNHNAPSRHAHEDQAEDTVGQNGTALGDSQVITDRSVRKTEYIGTNFDTYINAPSYAVTETADIESVTPSEDVSSTNVYRPGPPLIMIEQGSASELLSELFVGGGFPQVADAVNPEETVVEDFNEPTQIYEHNTTDIMNVNPNGERNTWSNVQDTYYVKNDGYHSTYTWTTSGSTECSATCTRGVSTRSPYCQDPDGKRVSDHYCDSSVRPNPGFSECDSQDCEARWEVGMWNECSKTCGEGRITRLVNCWRMLRQGLDSTVDNRQCAHIPKPNSSESCEIIPCGPTWRSSEWKSCNVSCGEGYETRDVQCVGPPQLSCDQSTKPSTVKPCTAGICRYRWDTSEWSPCPGICGVQTRTMECQSYNGTRIAPEWCRDIDRPYGTQLCGAKTCSRRWIPQQWSPCSVKCGQGTRTRSILCASVEFNQMRVYPEESGYCNGMKPPTTSHCITSDCVDRSIGQWFTSEWSQCSATCGNGHRQREVKCYYNRVEVNGCKDLTRPVSRMVCRNSLCVEAAQSNVVCKDMPDQNCRLIRTHQLCRLNVYKRKCCATCSSP